MDRSAARALAGCSLLLLLPMMIIAAVVLSDGPYTRSRVELVALLVLTSISSFLAGMAAGVYHDRRAQGPGDGPDPGADLPPLLPPPEPRGATVGGGPKTPAPLVAHADIPDESEVVPATA